MLSSIEHEIFELIVQEAIENVEIAGRLGMTPRGVKFHVSNILRKFGVAKREQLILLYWTTQICA